MNILITADYATPKSGNFIASLISLGHNIRKQGDNSIFIFPKERDWQEWIKREGFQVLLADTYQMRDEEQIHCLESIVKKYQINIIHTHFGYFNHAIIRGRKHFKNVKFLFHDHMDFSVNGSIRKQKVKCILRSGLYAINGIAVVAVMEEKLKYYPFVLKKWYLPNGLSLERNVPYSLSREDMRKQLGISDNESLCLLLGWDLKRKGLDIAIRAIDKLRTGGMNISLGVIGIGTEPNDQTKRFLSSCGLDDSLPWMHYFESYEDMFAINRAIDVYLSASRKEGFSYGLLEAVSQNTPVVVSNIPGTRWVGIYSKCVFYPTEDAEKCAKAISKALKMGRIDSNYHEVIKKYDIDKWSDSLIGIYKSL